MEEQSCVLLENGRRISAFASQLPFMRGTALPPDPGIKNRQAPCGACRFLSMGYEKDGFVFLIDGFEPPKLTNLSHSIQHCPEANHPNNE